jgi:hypothetical protein
MTKKEMKIRACTLFSINITISFEYFLLKKFFEKKEIFFDKNKEKIQDINAKKILKITIFNIVE